MEQVIEISKGLLTPVIAIVATYIAYQQWQTNRKRNSDSKMANEMEKEF